MCRQRLGLSCQGAEPWGGEAGDQTAQPSDTAAVVLLPPHPPPLQEPGDRNKLCNDAGKSQSMSPEVRCHCSRGRGRALD